MKKIYKVIGCSPLSEWDLEKVKKLPGDFFVYNYKHEGYEGTGIAVWQDGKKYGYAYLGHCSCNGPVEDLNSIMYTLPQLKKLSRKGDYEWTHGQAVMERIDALLERRKHERL